MAAKGINHSRLATGNTANHDLRSDATQEERIKAKFDEIHRLRKYQYKHADPRPK